jgi:hypothetical protein
MNFSGKWIFSAKQDVIYFSGTLVLSAIIVILMKSFSFLPNQETTSLTFLFFILFSEAHVYSTLFRTYFNSKELVTHPKKYFFIPLTTFLVAYFFYRYSSLVFYRLISYAIFFHIIRQQIGFVALAAVPGPDADKNKKWDYAFVYIISCCCLLWRHGHQTTNYFGHFIPGDMIQIPTHIADTFLPIMWIYLSLYILRSAYQFYKTQNLPVSKFHILITTLAFWYFSLVHIDATFYLIITKALFHGLPYMALIYKNTSRLNSVNNIRFPNLIKKKVLFFIFLIFLLAYLENWGWYSFIYTTSSPWFLDTKLVLSESAFAFTLALLWTPALAHVVIDGFIWKRKNLKEFQTE